MAWVSLFVAGLFEIAWAVGLKYSHGFTRMWPTLLSAVAMVASLGCLGLALRTLPLGTAYPIWVGIGTLGTTVVGMLLLGDSPEFWRLGCLALIAAGVVGLKVVA